jgi:hypothetical protein
MGAGGYKSQMMSEDEVLVEANTSEEAGSGYLTIGPGDEDVPDGRVSRRVCEKPGGLI